MAYTTIHIQSARRYGLMRLEKVAAGTITPGFLLEMTTADKVQAHSAAGGNVGAKMVALETLHPATGTTPAIDQDYSADDNVYIGLPVAGDVVYMWAATGNDVAIGDVLESNGAGMLQLHTPQAVDEAGSATYNIYTNQIVGIAVEAVDATSADLRIAVRIV